MSLLETLCAGALLAVLSVSFIGGMVGIVNYVKTATEGHVEAIEQIEEVIGQYEYEIEGVE